MTNNIAVVPLAHKLKLAIESCEPDIFRLLSTINECLSHLEVLLGENTKKLQRLDFEVVINALDSISESRRIGAMPAPGNFKLKDAMTQTDASCPKIEKEFNDILLMMQQQKVQVLQMLEHLYHKFQRYLPVRKTLDELEEEFMVIRENQQRLNEYLEYLKYEIIKHRVRPGKERISILMQEQQKWRSNLHIYKSILSESQNAYRGNDRFTALMTMVQEQILADIKMESLLDILLQVVSLQDNQDSIELWINRQKDPTHYMKELEIRMKCYTSQERMCNISQMESIKRYERAIFGNRAQFERDLNVALQNKSNLIKSIEKLEQLQDKKFKNYLLALWYKSKDN